MLESGQYSVATAAAEIGLDENSVHARRRDKEFVDLLQKAQDVGQAARETDATSESSAAPD